jgi:hypothetical protein
MEDTESRFNNEDDIWQNLALLLYKRLILKCFSPICRKIQVPNQDVRSILPI